MKLFGPHRPERVLLRRNTLYFRGMIFKNSIAIVTDGSFTADSGLLWPTGCKHYT